MTKSKTFLAIWLFQTFSCFLSWQLLFSTDLRFGRKEQPTVKSVGVRAKGARSFVFSCCEIERCSLVVISKSDDNSRPFLQWFQRVICETGWCESFETGVAPSIRNQFQYTAVSNFAFVSVWFWLLMRYFPPPKLLILWHIHVGVSSWHIGCILSNDEWTGWWPSSSSSFQQLHAGFKWVSAKKWFKKRFISKILKKYPVCFNYPEETWQIFI